MGTAQLLQENTMKERKPKTRTRREKRMVDVVENRCHWCGEWFETNQPTRALYCPQPKLCRSRSSRADLKALER